MLSKPVPQSGECIGCRNALFTQVEFFPVLPAGATSSRAPYKFVEKK